MTNLISGKEALIALANGKTVEVKRIHDNEWQPAQIFGVSVFTDSETTSFRLKPRTIKLELEIPAPFEPNDNENFYVIDCDSKDGYRKISNMIHSSWAQFGAWRTEEQIKQVVAALRQISGRFDDAVNAARGGNE